MLSILRRLRVEPPEIGNARAIVAQHEQAKAGEVADKQCPEIAGAGGSIPVHGVRLSEFSDRPISVYDSSFSCGGTLPLYLQQQVHLDHCGS